MFQGSMVALITPFTGNGIDEQALTKMVERQITEGTECLVAVGTTGESPTLSEAEHMRVIQLVVEVANKRVPVIAGAGSNNPVEASKYAQAAQGAGADALLCVAGYYNRPSQEGLYLHFAAVHDACELPIIVYNHPPRTGVDILPATMARLAALPRIVGVKDSTGDLSRCSEERLLIDKEFSWLSGNDPTALAYNAGGGNGCISVAANLVPSLCRKLHALCAENDFKAALTLHQRMFPLFVALMEEPSPAGVKYAASLLGLCEDRCRLPIVALAAETKHHIKAVLRQLELID